MRSRFLTDRCRDLAFADPLRDPIGHSEVPDNTRQLPLKIEAKQKTDDKSDT